MTFTGFKAKFLEYEGSLVTPTKIVEHLNTCLFQTLLKNNSRFIPKEYYFKR